MSIFKCTSLTLVGTQRNKLLPWLAIIIDCPELIIYTENSYMSYNYLINTCRYQQWPILSMRLACKESCYVEVFIETNTGIQFPTGTSHRQRELAF